VTSTRCKEEKQAAKPRRIRFGELCVPCKQRIKPFHVRVPLYDASRRLIGWRHSGC
jgi:hypothetical protein